MSRHSHHHHHMRHVNETDFSTSVSTTASTIVQAAITTMMAHSMHEHSSYNSSEEYVPNHAMVSDPHGPNVTNHAVHLSDHHFYNDHVGNFNHMLMYFHGGVDAIILFKEWNISTTQGMVASIIGIFLMSMVYEGIKFFREYMFKKYYTSLEYSSVSVLGDDGKTVTEVHKVARNHMFSWPHTIQTILHMTQMILSYFLMLIFMTFNVWLCLGVVLGAGAGYFLFGWKKATVVDITEHCH